MTAGARSNELEDPQPLQLTEPELAVLSCPARIWLVLQQGVPVTGNAGT